MKDTLSMFVDNNYRKRYFNHSIRKKRDYIRLILNVSRYILIYKNIFSILSDNSCDLEIKLKIKSKRLYFYEQNRFFSISYPLKLEKINDEYRIFTANNGYELNNQTISYTLAILNNSTDMSLLDYFLNYTPSDDLNNFSGESEEIDKGFYILEELYKFEPAYIRYDYDEKNEDGNKHPLNHLDINYSSYGTYKIGLRNRISHQYFEDMLNTNVDCKFLEK